MSHGLPSWVVAKSSVLPSSDGEVTVIVGAALTTYALADLVKAPLLAAARTSTW